MSGIADAFSGVFGGSGDDISDALKDLSGGDLKPRNIGTPSRFFEIRPAGLNVRRRGSQDDILNRIGTLSRRLGGGLGDLRRSFLGRTDELLEQVRPGFGRLTTSRLQEVENARRRAIGNLRETAARRRTTGSSFSQDALARAEAEFGQQAERVQAESFLQELELTNNLILEQASTAQNLLQAEFNALLTEPSVDLEESRFEAQVALDLLNSTQNAANANASVISNLAIANADLASQGAGLLSAVGGTVLGPSLARGGTSLRDIIFGTAAAAGTGGFSIGGALI